MKILVFILFRFNELYFSFYLVLVFKLILVLISVNENDWIFVSVYISLTKKSLEPKINL